MARDPIAKDLAQSQQEISIAEFIQKNRQILGFGSSARSLITTVKEAVDNALDATEEAQYLPDIYVEIKELKNEEYKIIVEDNGPGVIKEQIPSIFGKLLYGSRFHTNRQSLVPDEEILIKRNGDLKFVEIGNFCEKQLEDDENGKIEGVKVPAFNRKTGNIRWRDVSKAIKHKRKNEVYKIKTTKNRELEVTGNHSVFSIDKGEIKEVKVSELGEEDYILAPKKIKTKNQKTEVNVLNTLSYKTLKNQSWFVYGVDENLIQKLKEEGKRIRKVSGDTDRKRTFYRINGLDIRKDSIDFNFLKENYLPSYIVKKMGWEDKVSNCELVTYKRGEKTSFPITIPLNKDFMRFLGLYVAEGYNDKRQIAFTMGDQEQKLLNELKQTSNQLLNVNTTLVNRERNSKRLKVFGGPLSNLMGEFCGEGAHNKKIPNFVFKAPSELRQHFIDGLFDGDGSDSHPSNQLDYFTVSEKLAKQLSLLLNMQGIVSSWEEFDQVGISGKKSRKYVLKVFGGDINKFHKFETKNTSNFLTYQGIPTKLFEDLIDWEPNLVRCNTTPSGILRGLGIGSGLEYSEVYKNKINKILRNQEVEKDRFIKNLKELNLIIETNNGFKTTDKLKKLIKRIRDVLSLIKDDLVFLDIKEINKKQSQSEHVYDISVPDQRYENFVAGRKGLLFAKNSRGQQGIGISAAVLYGQITTGKPARIISKISADEPAHRYEINIDTDTNEPRIIGEEETTWSRPHGTRIEINVEGMYVRNRKQSVYNYLKHNAIVNPHARFTFVEPDGEETVFERGVNELPDKAEEIKPHPEGIELGTLMNMLEGTERTRLSSFLKNEFTKVGRTTVDDILDASGLDGSLKPQEMGREEAKKLINAFDEVSLISPPTDCLSPIGEEQIEEGLNKEYPGSEFISSVTRSAEVHSGNPFIVEAGIAYGMDKPEEEKAEVLRFANRVPLLYQKGGCVITKAIKNIDWRRYELNQPGGNGIPKGKAVLLVHVASTNVPFTSESKDAIANVEIIRKEVERAVRGVGRDLSKHLKKQKKMSKRSNKRKTISKILPQMVDKIESITGKEVDDLDPVLAKITNNLLINYSYELDGDGTSVVIDLYNFDARKKEFDLHVPIPYEVKESDPEPSKKDFGGDETTYIYDISLSSGEKLDIKLDLRTQDEIELDLLVDGVPNEVLTGAGSIRGD
ncbi:DNA topoisomerase VI subunit B [archaeon SCG-AAA382B04]|nr:DNA topoisomerase VI subunit B [archaeon SCG-AAA382B04]